MDFLKIESVITKLNARGYIANYFESSDDAVDYVLSQIPQSVSVGFGGSETTRALGLPAKLFARGNQIYCAGFSAPDVDVLGKARTAGFYITSSNAVTEEGDLINIDGRCNRIGAMLDGPNSVIFIASVDKICKNIDEGILRVRTLAAPKNCERLKRDTPCLIGGPCADCPAAISPCRATLISHFPPFGKKYHIILIKEKLGY